MQRQKLQGIDENLESSFSDNFDWIETAVKIAVRVLLVHSIFCVFALIRFDIDTRAVTTQNILRNTSRRTAISSTVHF